MLATLLLLTGCDSCETVANADGEVYECKMPTGAIVELCFYEDSAAELAARIGALTCGLSDRWWPVFTNAIGRGCVYSCKPHDGCNAKQGCAC